jgi:hypothetical protein
MKKSRPYNMKYVKELDGFLLPGNGRKGRKFQTM